MADGLGRQRARARRPNRREARLVRVHAVVRGDGHGAVATGTYYDKTRRAVRTVRQGLLRGRRGGHGVVGRRRRHPLPDLLQRTGARRGRGGARGHALRRRLEVGVGELFRRGRAAVGEHAVGHGQLPVERVRRRELRVRGRAHRRGQRVPGRGGGLPRRALPRGVPRAPRRRRRRALIFEKLRPGRHVGRRRHLRPQMFWVFFIRRQRRRRVVGRVSDPGRGLQLPRPQGPPELRWVDRGY